MIIVAYNQKEYIGEAVSHALTQDYPNLQVILSDDGSSDGTFEIMEALAAAYDGPHDVVLNRTAGGGGIVAHLFHALRHADGALVVGAAGDDMSAPDRVSKLVAAWHRSGAAVIYSGWNKVDTAGRHLARCGAADQGDGAIQTYFPGREVTIAFGCTAAYDHDFLRSIPKAAGIIWAEDYYLSAIATMTGAEILYIDDALVDYRQNATALRNFRLDEVHAVVYEERESRFNSGQADLLTALLAIIDGGRPPVRIPIDRQAIEHDIAWHRYRAEWGSRGLLARARYVAGLRSGQRLRWALPRLIGLRAFLAVKRLAAPLRS